MLLLYIIGLYVLNFKNYEKSVLLRLSCVAKENNREYLYLYLESDKVHWCILEVKQMAVTSHIIYGWVNCERLEWEDFMTLDDEFDGKVSLDC